MKKRKIFTLLLSTAILLGIFTGCNSAPDQSSSQLQEPAQTVDLESMGLTALEPTQEQREEAIASPRMCSYMYESISLEDLCTYADAAVRGRVVDSCNVVYDDNGYTAYTIQVDQSYFGQVQTGGAVTMLMTGGYVPLANVIRANDMADRFSDIPEAEWETTLVHQSVLGSLMPEEGQEYVFFLTRDNRFPGCYFPFNDGEGILRLSDSEGVYHRMVENEEGLDLISAQTPQAMDAQCIQTRAAVQEQAEAIARSRTEWTE